MYSKLREGVLKSLSGNALLAAVVLLAVLVRLYPLFLPSFPDPDFYYHLRLSQQAYAQGGVPSFDALSDGGRPYTYYPFLHFSTAVFAQLLGVGVQAAYAILPLLVAVASVLAVYLLARKLFGERAALLAAFCAALIPGLIAKSTVYARPDEYAMLLLPMALLFALEGKNVANALLFFAFGLIHAHVSVVSLGVFFFVFFVFQGVKDWKPYAFAGAGLAVGLLYYLKVGVRQLLIFAVPPLAIPSGSGWGKWKKYAFPAIGLAAGTLYGLQGSLAQLFALNSPQIASAELQSLDFTFILFYSGLFLVLGLVALYELRGEFGRKENKLLLAWVAADAALVLAANRGIVFFAPPLALLCGVGLERALQKSGEHAKAFLAFLLVLLAFSTAVFLSSQHGGFTQKDIAAAQWLGNNSNGSLVASYWDRGHFLTYYGNKVFLDAYFEYTPNLSQRVAVTEALMNSGNATQAYRIARANGIQFVFLDERALGELPPGSIWESNSTTGFTLVYWSGARVWEIKLPE